MVTAPADFECLFCKVERQQARIAELEKALEASFETHEPNDEWSTAIADAFPTRSGSHDQYGVAMRMVSNRYTEPSLVALVNWLLVRIFRLESELRIRHHHAMRGASWNSEDCRNEIAKVRP